VARPVLRRPATGRPLTPTHRKPTDFEQLGFSSGPVHVPGRYWVRTVDFEAFRPEHASGWIAAMRGWAEESIRVGTKSSMFIAVEDIVRLRQFSRSAYDDFLEATVALHRSGCVFYPHNHCLFDLETGLRPTEEMHAELHIPGYAKQASMFFDVVYRNKADFGQWVLAVRATYEQFLADAGLPLPEPLAFRPGGWDHGSDKEEIATYLEAVEGAGFTVDSSASAGHYATRSHRLNAKYGYNVFQVGDALTELAPTWFIDCGASIPSIGSLGSARQFARQPRAWIARQPGAWVTVAHFDHLFHTRAGRRYNYFSVMDLDQVRKRIRRFMDRTQLLATQLDFEVVSIESLPLPTA